MPNRKLGRTDLSVSPLCLGGNVFGWTADEKSSFAVLDAYVDGGGNFIDTADTYGVGASESILGRWLSSRKNRDRVIIATKVGSRMGNDPHAQGLSRRHIMAEAEASLKRLQIDVIDLYQAHRDDPNTPLEETMAAFNDLVQQGKVRYVGASNYSAARLRHALDVSTQHHYARYECLQPLYNLLDRGDYEGDLMALCLQEEIGVITFFSLARGFLTGKYRPGQEMPYTPRAKGIQDRYLNERGFGILEQLDRIAAAHHTTVAQVALAWIMARPGITSAIASATSVDQIRELLGSVDVHLSTEEMETLNRG